MYETAVTLTGNVASDPTLRVTTSGVKVASFRVASTERRYDKGAEGWRDGDTLFARVSCWRAAAENVVDSLAKGQPVVVHGRLRLHSYDAADGQRRSDLEIDAWTVGHDLSRGVAQFRRSGARREEPLAAVPTPSPVLPPTPVPAGDEVEREGSAA